MEIFKENLQCLQGQKFIADAHKHVVVLFSDIVNFTLLSSSMPTAEVFLMLSNMFNGFDRLIDQFGVYKVRIHIDPPKTS